jgi:p-aminobenzoyl-glutamate transporter AbgT
MIPRRLIFAALAGVSAGIVSAVVIAILDLYLSGHGYDGLARERVTWSALGIHLSIGDMFMLGMVLLSGLLAWWLNGRDA